MAVDYAAIAKKYGGISPTSTTPTSGVDYGAIAKKYGGVPTTSPFDLFATPEPEKEQAGFLSAFKEQATTLGLADEFAAFVANPTEENRRAFIEAGDSKTQSAGGFGMEGGLARNWQAFREILGGSLGFMAAPITAGATGAVAGGLGAPITGPTAFTTTLASQYGIQDILRQAQAQEQAIAEGKTPQEISIGKAAVAAVGSTALDVLGMRLFSPLFNKFPGLKNLLGEADDAAVKETGRALEEAISNGKYKVTKGGVLIGAGKGAAFEIPQEIGQQVLERWQAGLPLTDADAQEEYKQAAIGAALLGAPMGGAGSAIRTMANKDEALKKLTAERAEEQKAIEAEQAETARIAEEDKAAEAKYGLQVAKEKELADAEAIKQGKQTPVKTTPVETTPVETTPTTPKTTESEQLDFASLYPVETQLKKLYESMPADAPVTAIPMTNTILDALQIPKTSTLRKGKNSIVDKDINTPEVQDALRSYATNEVVLAKNKESSVRVKSALDINRMLRNIHPHTYYRTPQNFVKKEKAVAPEVAPVEKAVAPVEKAVAPEVAPVEEAVALVEKAVAPAPVEKAVAPVEKAVAPAPVEKAVAPVEEAVVPEVAPVEEAVAPVEEAVAPVEEAVAPEVAPVEEAVAPVEEAVTPVEEAVTPVEEAVTPVEEAVTPVEEVIERPAVRIPLRPTSEEVETSTPNAQQVNRVGEVMGGDIRAVKADQKHPLYRKGGIEAAKYTVHQTPTGVNIHRVTYNDGSIRTVAFNKNGTEIAREFTPAEQKPLALVANAIDNTAVPLSDLMIGNLQSLDLKSALDLLGVDKNISKSLRTVAKALARVVGSTKIKIVDRLTDANGKPVAGLFDPKTNTISLDSETGLNSHVLLHEQTHAVVSATLDNASHPLTKKLTKLFNQVRPYLDTAYGAENIQEFVSEAFTNPSFQQKLASIINKGEPLSAFERFVNAITNFVRGMFGLPHKQQGIRSMDDLNATIMSIMAPAPEYRNAGELFMADPNTAAAQIDDAVSSVPSMNSVKAETYLKTLVESADDVIKAIGAQVTSLPVLIKFATKYIPFANRLYDIINLQEGYRKKIRGKGEKLILDIQTWAAGNKDTLKTFSDLINYSTREEIDASLSEKEAGFKYRNDQVKLDAWDTWSRVYEKMDPTGKMLYKKVFDAYKFLRNEFLDTFKLKLKNAGATDEQIKETIKSVEAKLLELGLIEPFASLSRNEGNFWAYYTAKDPVTGKMEFTARNFPSKFARNRHLKELEEANVQVSRDVSLTENFDVTKFRNAPPGSFVNSVVETLRKNKVSGTVEEDILRMFANLLPENAYFRGMTQKRKGTIGFLDAIAALDNSFKKSSVLLASSRYESDLRTYETDLLKFANDAQNKNTPNKEKITQYQKALKLHVGFALNPNVQNWAKVATSAGFNYGLGFNISGYLINGLALPSVIAPYIAGEHVKNYKSLTDAYTDTAKAIARSFSIFRNSKSFVTGLNHMGLEGYDFNDPNLPPALQLFKVLQNEMQDKGQFKLTSVDKELDVENISLGPLDKVFGKDWFAKFNRASGWFMSHSEQVLRETTIMSEYQMHLAQQLDVKINELDAAFSVGRITPDMMKDASSAAIYTADLLNSGVMAQMAPFLSKRGLGKVVFLFRKYSTNLFGLLLHLANTSLRGSEADKKVARAQFAGVFAATTIVSGIGGAPLFGTLALIYNLFKDDDDDDLETVLRKTIDGRLYGGLGNYVLGAEISSRAGLSNFIFREPFATSNQPYLNQALEVLGGPIVGMGMSMKQGLTRIGEGNVSRGVELMLPTGLRNPLKALRFYTEGAQTMDGDQMMPPVDEKEAVFQILGLAPAEYTYMLEKNSATYKANRAVAEKRSDIYRRYFKAFQDHDIETKNEIMQEIAEYNKKYPDYPISGDDIIQSIKKRLRGQVLSLDSINVAPRLRQRYIESREEWDSVDTLWGDIFEEE
jgi:hypothetical protein